MKPVEPVQVDIYQSNTYRKDLSWLHLAMSQGFKGSNKWGTNSTAYPFLWLIQQFQVAITTTSSDITAIFHTYPYGRFIDIQTNFRRRKLHRTNRDPNFLGGSFRNRDNVGAQIQSIRESQPQYFKRWFFFKKKPIHFHINSTSALRLLKQN